MKKAILLASLVMISLSIFSQVKPEKKTGGTSTGTEQKVTEKGFFIIGIDTDFKLLEKAILYPDDVTANEKKAIIQWIKQRQMLPTDSTKQKH